MADFPMHVHRYLSDLFKGEHFDQTGVLRCPMTGETVTTKRDHPAFKMKDGKMKRNPSADIHKGTLFVCDGLGWVKVVSLGAA